MKYERYMVFIYGDYDNVSPFDCMKGSFDSCNEATEFALELIEDMPDSYIIFDRVEGVVL